MDWEKASPDVADALRPFMVEFDCILRPMFGSDVYFKNGNMFTGVKGSKVFLRLSAEDRRLIMDEDDEVQPFEPRPAFFMKEYVEIPESKLSDQDFIKKWLQISYSYVASLQPKVKKNPKASNRNPKS